MLTLKLALTLPLLPLLLPLTTPTRYEAEFIEDMASLNIRMPDALTRVTEYLEKVPEQGTYNPIVDYVAAIVAKGHAYESNGSVYMDIGALRGGGHAYPKLEP
tara:strand:- start:2003 stop:2311 length:309 start_codon:yes stop_codon:yes gene_type:complete